MTITYVQQMASQVGLNAGANNLTPGYAVSKGDVLVLSSNTPVSGGAIGTFTVSDTTNGSWTLLQNQYDSTNGQGVYQWFVQMTAAVGSPGPSITVNCQNSPNDYCQVSRFNGFLGTATKDPNSNANVYGSSASAASLVVTTATNFPNEILLLVIKASSFLSTDPPTGWSGITSATQYYQVLSTAGSANISDSFSSPPALYDVIVNGIYDVTGGGATIAWIT
jgi:hypothetical protein